MGAGGCCPQTPAEAKALQAALPTLSVKEKMELFDLLDLRRPELWEGYRKFRQDLWEAIKSRKFATMGDRAQASIELLSMVYNQQIA